MQKELTGNFLNKTEVLRYLGYQGTELLPHTERLIEECMAEVPGLVRPAYLYRRYRIKRSAEGILLVGTDLCLTGKDIAHHLEGCEELYLVCATVGTLLDRQIRLKMVTDPAAGVVLDSCGSVAVEQVIEIAEQEIEKEAAAFGKQITWRFSPGYGDLPLELQRGIADVLDLHRKLGVSVSEDMLLAPSKSVTAIIGIMETGNGQEAGDMRKTQDRRKIQKCERCNNRDRCNFYHKGKNCSSIDGNGEEV